MSSYFRQYLVYVWDLRTVVRDLESIFTGVRRLSKLSNIYTSDTAIFGMRRQRLRCEKKVQDIRKRELIGFYSELAPEVLREFLTHAGFPTTIAFLDYDSELFEAGVRIEASEMSHTVGNLLRLETCNRLRWNEREIRLLLTDIRAHHLEPTEESDVQEWLGMSDTECIVHRLRMLLRELAKRYEEGRKTPTQAQS